MDARALDLGSVALSAPCEPEGLLSPGSGFQCNIQTVMPALPLQAGYCSAQW